MSTWSAFGVGGWDPLGSFGESQLAMHNSRSLMRYQYKMARKYALNSPSWNVVGLRDAGLNPILAATGGGFSNVSTPSVPSGDLSHSASGVGNTSLLTLGDEKRLLKAQADSQRKQGDSAEMQGKAALENAKTNQWLIHDARQEGLQGFKVQYFPFGVGGEFETRTIQTLRINKVTGETFDALTGKRVRVLGEAPTSSAKTVPDGEVTVKYEPYTYDEMRRLEEDRRVHNSNRNAVPWRVSGPRR